MTIYQTEKMLDVEIHTLDPKILWDKINSNYLERKQSTVVCANPHSLVLAQTDPHFLQALNESDIVLPDGAGIIIGSKILGGDIRERVTGTDLFLLLAEKFNVQGGRFFFYGSTERVLNKIRARLSTDFPNIKWAGSYSPPFGAICEKELSEAILRINASKPDVLWVGMTAPKQEKWIYANRSRLDVPILGAIGAAFDFYAGTEKRSSPFWQDLGLEWLPRLLRNPTRLWRRTVLSVPLFLWRILCQRLSAKKNTGGLRIKT